ncbi:hypothetical protein PRUPE_5G051900 [Prunus persica]|uniref:Leucine-rich repeat-containing N-terminal plant-type domain-containing protein n=1 Tax=Prunus persica TaxID=3760 RepID=A0A251P3Z0_PRUPE|nr:hypothetical protein PRUPE_5G051900 [Prunus persica]
MISLNFSKVVSWPQTISKLSSLIELQLSKCDLPEVDLRSSMPFINSSSTSLQVLELYENLLLNTSIFYRISNLSSNLVHIGLGGNQLQGPIPDVFTNMVSLTSLQLFYNNLEASLQTLFISNHQLKGSLPQSGGQLSSLEVLELSWNSLNGVITEAHFLNLSRLQSSDISHNPSLYFNFSSDWNPLFQLDI